MRWPHLDVAVEDDVRQSHSVGDVDLAVAVDVSSDELVGAGLGLLTAGDDVEQGEVVLIGDLAVVVDVAKLHGLHTLGQGLDASHLVGDTLEVVLHVLVAVVVEGDTVQVLVDVAILLLDLLPYLGSIVLLLERAHHVGELLAGIVDLLADDADGSVVNSLESSLLNSLDVEVLHHVVGGQSLLGVEFLNLERQRLHVSMTACSLYTPIVLITVLYCSTR